MEGDNGALSIGIGFPSDFIEELALRDLLARFEILGLGGGAIYAGDVSEIDRPCQQCLQVTDWLGGGL
ncbi:hypothetical protein WM40_25975 [Robbsia andropogonis]|uniref:Uncharacterized protein n=1 Tax=Robbsia andropogonis TaxID=28092 RepID=A0A0F5JTJ7_9BURK|nr:hypothetical protein WM40_25975 [Robbsia andropogonis]